MIVKLQPKFQLKQLTVPRRIHTASPCKPILHFAILPCHSISLPKLSFRSLPFIRPTSPLRFPASPYRILCKSTKNSDMISQFELQKPDPRWKPEKRVTGIFWILLLNLGIFVADHVFQVQWTRILYLYHNRPSWYQFVTATFCHSDWNHLSSNLFFLYIFGKLVEEEEGNFAVWLSYILTGVGANLVSWLVLPRNTVSLGASGAVFGLFAISVLVKMSWDWRKILEVLILGQFVIERVMEAAKASASLVGGGSSGAYGMQNINYLAHLSGALIGVALIWLVSRIPSGLEDDHNTNIKKK